MSFIIVLILLNISKINATEIIIPVKENVLNYKNSDQIYMKKEDFIELYKKAYSSKLVKNNNNEIDHIYSNINYKITLKNKNALVKASAFIKVNKKGFLKIFFPYSKYLIRNFTINNKLATLKNNELILKGKKEFKLNCSFYVPIKKESDVYSIKFPSFDKNKISFSEIIPTKFDIILNSTLFKDNNKYFMFSKNKDIEFKFKIKEKITDKFNNAETLYKYFINKKIIDLKFSASLYIKNKKNIILNIPDDLIIKDIVSTSIEKWEQNKNKIILKPIISGNIKFEITFILKRTTEFKIENIEIEKFNLHGCVMIKNEKLNIKTINGLSRKNSFSDFDYVFNIDKNQFKAIFNILETKKKNSVHIYYSVNIFKNKIEYYIDINVIEPEDLIEFDIPQEYKFVSINPINYEYFIHNNKFYIYPETNYNNFSCKLKFERKILIPQNIKIEPIYLKNSDVSDTFIKFKFDKDIKFKILNTSYLYQRDSKNLSYNIMKDNFNIELNLIKKKALVDIKTALYINVKNEMMIYNNIIDIIPKNSSLNKFEFFINTKEKPFVYCDRTREIKIKYKNNNWQVICFMKQPISDEFKIIIDHNKAITAKISEVKLDHIFFPIKNNLITYAFIENNSSYELYNEISDNFERVSNIPYFSNKIKIDKLYRSYVSYNNKYNLKYSIRKIENDNIIKASIKWSHIKTFMNNECVSLTKAFYKIKNNTKNFLKVQLPSNSILYQVKLDDNIVKTSKNKNGDHLIPLKRASIGSLDQLLTIIYRIENVSGFSLKAPIIKDIEVEKTFFTAILPEDYWYFNFSTNMNEINKQDIKIDYLNELLDDVKKMKEISKNSDIVQKYRSTKNLVKLKNILDKEKEEFNRNNSYYRKGISRISLISKKIDNISKTLNKYNNINNINKMQNEIWQQNVAQQQISSNIFKNSNNKKIFKNNIIKYNKFKIPENGKHFYFVKSGGKAYFYAYCINFRILKLILLVLILFIIFLLIKIVTKKRKL